MAVEIPVVIDIDKAFEDAAKRVDSAIKPLQRKISDNALDIELGKVTIDDEEISVTLREIKEKGADAFGGLEQWINSANSKLVKFAQSGDSVSFKSILEAKHYLIDMSNAIRSSELEMDGLAKTINGINAKLSSARITLENTRVNSAEWRGAVKEIQKATTEIGNVQRKMSELGTKTGSIDRVKLKIQELTDKWNAMSRSQKFDKDGKLKSSAQKLIDKYKQLTYEAEKYGMSLEQAAKGAKSETKNLNTELETSKSRLDTLVKNSIRLIALHSATRFIRNIREVTAQFELQKVALGSIIQDAEKANSLFKQIKVAAVESPFEIKDLVTYTKQLSAYQIETEKLFDTTMKLADISSGLGVDMGRLILAFGQVRAAAVLRGQELRQFTEAGIPLVDKLAQKFSELNGRAVSTAEVFELISKRAVPFSMIEDIFNDLTSAGGAFYKMQEKQAETLLGQWNNLKDSISIMYDEIGNTNVVHSAMESLISDTKKIMQNWRQVADVVKFVGIQYGTMKLATLFLPILTRDTKLLEKAELAEARAKRLSNAAHNNKILEASSRSLRAYAYYTILASRATTKFGRALNIVRATISGNWISLVLTALGFLVANLISAKNEANRLNKELSKISSEGAIKIEQSIRNFERLARSATNAADGSKEQKNAIDELIRTYGDILPPSDKLIDKLKEMKGNYTSLTDAIREKINIQLKEQKVDEITSEYGTKIGNKRDTLKKYLKEKGLSPEEISAVIGQLQNAVNDGLIGTEQDILSQAKFIEKIIYEYTGKYVKLTESVYSKVAGAGNKEIYQGEKATTLTRIFSSLVQLYSDMNNKIKEVEEDMDSSIGVIGKYGSEWKNLKKELSDFEGIGDTKFAKNESRIKKTVDKSISFIQEKFNENKIDISDAIINGTPNFDILSEMVEKIKDSSAQISLRGIIKDFKKEYENLIPDDKITQASKLALKEASDAFGMSMDKLTGYIKIAGKDSKEYLKELKQDIDGFNSKIQEMERSNKVSMNRGWALKYKEGEIQMNKDYANSLQYVYDILKEIINIEENGGRDKYLQDLRNRINDITNAYKKYIELLKYMGKDKAMENIRTFFPSLDFEPTYDEMVKKLERMLASYKGDADATRIIEQALANVKYDKVKKSLEDNLKKLSAEIKRSETARNFYNEILWMTGDKELAETMTVSIYTNIGDEFKERMQEELQGALSSLKAVESYTVTDELEKAFANMDFERILKEEKLPENVEKVVREAYEKSQKYDADILKNFANLVNKYGDTEQKIATISAKAINEIEKVKEAVFNTTKDYLTKEEVSEYLDITKPLEDSIDTYPDAVKNAIERAREIIKSIKGQEQLDIFKVSDDYIKFFSEINVLTTEQAVVVRGKLRDAYLKAFHDGAISADELKRNLRAIDEQFRKLNENQNLFTALFSGGFDGLNKKLMEYSDNITILAAKLKKGISLDSDEQAFATKMLKLFGGGYADTKGINSYTKLIEKFGSNSEGLSKAGDALGQMGEGIGVAASNAVAVIAIIDAILKGIKATVDGINEMISLLNEVRSETNKIKNEGWDAFTQWYDYTFSGWEKVKSGDVIGSLWDVINSWVSVAKNVILSDINKINKEIERQDKIIEGLEKSYENLEEAIQDSFGTEYVYNYNRMLENLASAAEAYRKQAELERSKGKAADENIAKEYDAKAEDAVNKTKQLSEELRSFFAGQDLSSAAESFADAWLQAYQEFGDTTGAIEERMQEMIQNLVKKAALSGIAQSVLGNWYKSLSDVKEWNAKTVAEKWMEAESLVTPMVEGMKIFTTELQSEGKSLRGTAGSFTGIARNIANASEESINGLAAGINTQNYYMQHIDQVVSAILLQLGGGAENSDEIASPNKYKETVLTQLSALPQMRDDIASIQAMLDKVIKPNGVASTHRVIIS